MCFQSLSLFRSLVLCFWTIAGFGSFDSKRHSLPFISKFTIVNEKVARQSSRSTMTKTRRTALLTAQSGNKVLQGKRMLAL